MRARDALLVFWKSRFAKVVFSSIDRRDSTKGSLDRVANRHVSKFRIITRHRFRSVARCAKHRRPWFVARGSGGFTTFIGKVNIFLEDMQLEINVSVNV